VRKRIEEVFGWTKAAAGFRKTHHRGLARVGWMFTLTATASSARRISSGSLQMTMLDGKVTPLQSNASAAPVPKIELRTSVRTRADSRIQPPELQGGKHNFC
jgi:hypothetical protein